jgi:hypothetical protein
MACNAATQVAQVTQIPVSTQTPLAVVNTPLVETATIAPTATTAPTQAPTDTLVPVATEPPMTATTAAIVNSYSATMEAMMGSEGALLNIVQYFYPVGTPVQNWHNVPVMTQATAWQEYSAIIYSYTAAATLEQAHQFYQSKAASLGFASPPGTGYSGSGNQASHNIDFVSHNLTIVLTSFDNDTSHVIVVISKIQ